MQELPPLVPRRMPSLDEFVVLGWLGGQRVIIRQGTTHSTEEGRDLEMGKSFLVPGLRRRDFREGIKAAMIQSSPMVSPDVRWILYEERNGYYVERDRERTRLRLVPVDGGRERLLPSGKRFTLRPAEGIFWQADSQGWITVDGELPQTLKVTRYSVKSDRAVSVQRVPAPFDLKLGLSVVGVTPRDELMVDDPKDERRLHFVPLRPGAAARSVQLPDTQYDLFPDCNTALVCLKVNDGASEAWELQRVPLFGGKAEKLLSLEQRAVGFALSADGKNLVYRLWQGPSTLITFWIRLP